MFRGMLIMVILTCAAACSQFGNDPTPTNGPPLPHTPTPTPTISWGSMYFDCRVGLFEYQGAYSEFNLRWSQDSYDGHFLFSLHWGPLSHTRLHDPPQIMRFRCNLKDPETDKLLDDTERPKRLYCVLWFVAISDSIQEFTIHNIDNQLYYSELLLDLPWQKARDYGRFQMQVSCVPSALYSDA